MNNNEGGILFHEEGRAVCLLGGDRIFGCMLRGADFFPWVKGGADFFHWVKEGPQFFVCLWCNFNFGTNFPS